MLRRPRGRADRSAGSAVRCGSCRRAARDRAGGRATGRCGLGRGKDALGTQPWSNGLGDKVIRQDYEPVGLVAAAPMSGDWFHQHFGISKEPLRGPVLTTPRSPYLMLRPIGLALRGSRTPPWKGGEYCMNYGSLS